MCKFFLAFPQFFILKEINQTSISIKIRRRMNDKQLKSQINRLIDVCQNRGSFGNCVHFGSTTHSCINTDQI